MSLISQALYVVVFLTRYLDLFKTGSAWNFILKIAFIASSIYTVCIMQWKFPRTRERELAWKITTVVVAGSAALAPFTMMIFEEHWGFQKVSQYCLLVHLNSQTNIGDSFCGTFPKSSNPSASSPNCSCFARPPSRPSSTHTTYSR